MKEDFASLSKESKNATINNLISKIKRPSKLTTSADSAAKRKKFVKLSNEEIEAKADYYLLKMQNAGIFKIPIPVDEFVEQILGLTIEFWPIKQPNIYGFISFEQRTIYVKENFENDRRYPFTVAHESEHWIDHQSYSLENVSFNKNGLLNNYGHPGFQTLTNKDRKRIETEANHFAACLLTPALYVKKEWDRIYGKREYKTLCSSQIRKMLMAKRDDRFRLSKQKLLDLAATPLTEKFGVSKKTMRNRLFNLKLFVRSPKKK